MAAPACEFLELVELNLKGEGRLFYQWWNFEVLAISPLLKSAAAEAATADMIVIGVHGGGALPGAVTEWMNEWITLRNDRPGILVAVMDSRSKKPDASSAILLQLRQAADLGHMDFFATRTQAEKDARLARRASDTIWRFVRTRKNSARNELPGMGPMPADKGKAAEQFRQAGS